ncbi:restriction endonuclease subunit S [Acetatifactor sp. DFI.5.50]|nr:restriction endonuclease subunit S [Lacrimispora saccharolytica]MCG4783233.1 restriction endonuclease subunit S [Acetatifactor sp. DFI.5.50]
MTIIQGKGTLPREQAGRNIHYDDSSLANYKKVKQGDFIIHLRSFEGGLEMANEDGIVSPAYTILRCKKPHSSLFYEAYFHTDEFINHILSKSVEGIRDGRQISYEAFKWLGLPYCDVSEQEKIAQLFCTLGQRIEKQQQMVDALKKYKRGVVSAILSHQLTFSDAAGDPYPEWTTCSLQDAVDFLDGQRKPLESADRAKRQGQYPYYGASGIIDYIDDFIFDEPLLLLGEDGANILNRSTPLCFIAEGKYWVNNHAHVMRPKAGQNIKFLCELLESLDYTRYNTGTAQPKLNQEKCRRIEIALPVYEEQCHIADFLSALDQRAAKAQSILDYLRSNRDGLLQQLFI